jgi:hypothetical protein
MFIFNPALTPVVEHPREEDYALCKILYYWPEEAPQFEKQSHVGLAEGLVMFANQFSTEPLHTIHTELHTHTVKEVEPDIWVVFIVRFAKKKNEMDYD